MGPTCTLYNTFLHSVQSSIDHLVIRQGSAAFMHVNNQTGYLSSNFFQINFIISVQINFIIWIFEFFKRMSSCLGTIAIIATLIDFLPCSPALHLWPEEVSLFSRVAWLMCLSRRGARTVRCRTTFFSVASWTETSTSRHFTPVLSPQIWRFSPEGIKLKLGRKWVPAKNEMLANIVEASRNSRWAGIGCAIENFGHYERMISWFTCNGWEFRIQEGNLF